MIETELDKANRRNQILSTALERACEDLGKCMGDPIEKEEVKILVTNYIVRAMAEHISAESLNGAKNDQNRT